MKSKSHLNRGHVSFFGGGGDDGTWREEGRKERRRCLAVCVSDVGRRVLWIATTTKLRRKEKEPQSVSRDPVSFQCSRPSVSFSLRFFVFQV